MSLKTLIFFGLLAVALGFTLPEENTAGVNDSEWVYGDVVPVADDVVLVRKARSPQGELTGQFEYHPQDGSSANFEYHRQISPNFDVYTQLGRNFKYNENHGQAGLRYTF